MADAYLHPIAWRRETDLALEIYRATQKVPKDELHGLASPMQRATVSVASNIVEGKGPAPARNLQFLDRARGSLLELETQSFIAIELHNLEPLVFRRMGDRTKERGRILNDLIKSVLEGINAAS